MFIFFIWLLFLIEFLVRLVIYLIKLLVSLLVSGLLFSFWRIVNVILVVLELKWINICVFVGGYNIRYGGKLLVLDDLFFYCILSNVWFIYI